MPSVTETTTAATTANGTVNGTANHDRPQTPVGGMALTEYSAHPSTPSEDKRARIKASVPEEFLLPSGYPDVGALVCRFGT